MDIYYLEIADNWENRKYVRYPYSFKDVESAESFARRLHEVARAWRQMRVVGGGGGLHRVLTFTQQNVKGEESR